MNPELWTKPYDYTFEEREVKGRFLKFFEDLTHAKRITHDPFKNTTNIRCTYQRCKQRYTVSELFFQNLSESQPKDIFYHLAGVHDHFLNELNFSRINSRCASTICKNNKELFICEQCGYAPFPSPLGVSSAWEHTCADKYWRLCLNKPNNMTWRQSTWVVQIDYIHSLWLWLYNDKRANYDTKNSCWLVQDTFANDVEISCRNRFPTFKRGQKPTTRPNQTGRALGTLNVRKVQAANEIVTIIAKTGSFRAVQAKLHPDKYPDNEKAEATKVFQDLQAAWNNWEKS